MAMNLWYEIHQASPGGLGLWEAQIFFNGEMIHTRKDFYSATNAECYAIGVIEGIKLIRIG